MPTADFSLPPGAIGRFAVVKLWSDIKTAEDECVARLRIAAQALGVECVEIYADGRLISSPGVKVAKDNVDFVLHLHYDTPKQYDAFSFVALWNPVEFYHWWGYGRCSRNLTTHDDFISCSSDAADDHLARMVRKAPTHLPPHFRLYHSTPDVMRPPSLGEGKLFYVGINWEAISGGKSRHQEVLKRLDKTGLLRIYGPALFQGVKVWAGYESYVHELPFDGMAVIEAIAKAGVALVLSSPAHKASALMSNRLFESLAAGALVICDENPFARKFFGDSLLYIDGRASVEQIHVDITRHLSWAKSHPDAALAKIAQAQEIFRRHFTLIGNLAELYQGLATRKRVLLQLRNPPTAVAPKVRLNLLLPEFSEAVLRAHVESIRVQDYDNLVPALVVDRGVAALHHRDIETALADAGVAVEVVEVDWFDPGMHTTCRARRPLGRIIHALLHDTGDADAFMVVAPNERLFSDHVAVLAGALQRDPAVHCAATAALLEEGGAPARGVHELIDFNHVDPNGPPGYGRFIFRIAAISPDIGIALPYLDGRPLAALVGAHEVHQQLQASIAIDVTRTFPERTWDDAAESAVIRDYCPEVLRLVVGFGGQVPATAPESPVSSLRQLARRLVNRRWLLAQIRAVRTQGLPARIQVLRRRFGW